MKLYGARSMTRPDADQQAIVNKPLVMLLGLWLAGCEIQCGTSNWNCATACANAGGQMESNSAELCSCRYP